MRQTSLFKQALELGAMPLPDLTDKVTHLLATECGSAKYKVRVRVRVPGMDSRWIDVQCAIERKILIMQPSWVTDCYETWLRGDDVDLAEVRTVPSF